MARVIKLGTYPVEEYQYTCGPHTAVICAYAQEVRRDFNTWDYEKRYGNMVKETATCFHLGDFSAMKDTIHARTQAARNLSALIEK